MRIRELYIDGFGIFRNTTVKDLHCGMNILFGSNEFGKTTLLEFIRRILFGFPKRTSAEINPYLPQNGDAHGGHLVCELANGETIRVNRTAGPNGGRVTVMGRNGAVQGQEPLSSLLDHASSDLFQNIFAFSLAELQVLGSLQGDEVKNRIYGAGLGLGPSALTEAEKHFQTYCEDRFKARGKNQKLNLLFEEMSEIQNAIQSIQKELSCYDLLQMQAKKLEEEKETLNDQIRDLDNHRRHFETLADLYPVYVEWERAQEELNSLGTPAHLPRNAAETLERMKTEIQNLNQRIEEEEDASKKLQIEIDHIPINEEILSCQNDVMTLRNMTDQICFTLKDQIVIGEKREKLDFEIQSDIRRIGKGWEEQAIMDFQCQPPEINDLQSQREALDQCRQKLSVTKERLEDHCEEQARIQSQIFRAPEWLRVIAYSLIGLGAVGLLGGGVMSDIPILTLSAAVLVLGGVSLRMIYKSHLSLIQPDQVGLTLQQRVTVLEKEQDRLFQQWRDWLANKGLDVYFSPIQAEKIIAVIKEIQNRTAQRTELDQRLEKMQGAIRKAETLIQHIYPETEVIGNHLPGIIQNLCSTFEESNRNHEKQSALKAQRHILAEKTQRLKDRVEENQKAMIEFIGSSGADSLEEFEDQCCIVKRGQILAEFCKEKKKFIESRIGLGDLFDQFFQTVRNTNPDQIQQDLETVLQNLNEAHAKRDSLNQQTGELKTHIGQLGSDEKLSQLRLDLEIKKTRLNRQAREWAIGKIASFMLEKTKRKYERERQPEVLRAAENYFSTITGNRYRKIYFSLDSEEIQIENGGSGFKVPAQMSRGTREQLYLALRLGLIEHYETRSEPLPVIMDDVLVNFDDERGLKVIEILKQFAEKRQVIILSCHQGTLETYKRLGAKAITLQTNP